MKTQKTIDRTTKILLGICAVLLAANLAWSILRPLPAEAQPTATALSVPSRSRWEIAYVDEWRSGRVFMPERSALGNQGFEPVTFTPDGKLLLKRPK